MNAGNQEQGEEQGKSLEEGSQSLTLKNLEPARPGAEAPTESFEALVQAFALAHSETIIAATDTYFQPSDEVQAKSDAAKATLLSRFSSLVKALEEIAENEGVCCHRCEGNGRLWADGKAHHPNENMPTRPCPPCNGEGRIYPNLQEIAIAALSQVKGGASK